MLKDACNAVPFSWRIRDYLEELWVQAQYITDTEGELPHGRQAGSMQGTRINLFRAGQLWRF